MKTKTQTKTETVEINPLEIMTLKVKIKGISPILFNKMSDKEKQSMLDKQTGKGVEKNKIRDIKQEVEDKIPKLPSGKIGVNIDAIKNALIESAPSLELYKKDVMGNLFIIPDENNYVYLDFKKMTINESMTRDSGINRTPRTTFRPQFNDWSCEFTIRYNAKKLTPNQIFNLVKVAGFSNGLGSWRPATRGSYGSFTLA